MVGAGLLVGAGSLHAQTVTLPWPWENAAPWHVAREWTAQGSGSDSAGDLDVLRAARAELALGRSSRAEALLAAHPLVDSTYAPVRLALQAAADLDAGHPTRAGRGYLRAAAGTGRSARGVLLARAGAAFAAAHADSSAADAYLAAASALPNIAGWLDLRAARHLTDPLRAAELLRAAPDGAEPLAEEIRATLWVGTGDTALAIEAFTRAGRHLTAARLAAARGDSLTARRLALAALADTDTTVVREAVTYMAQALPPRTAASALALGRGDAVLGDYRDAARWAARAVALGDASDSTALTRAEWLEQAGERGAALRLYARLARGTGGVSTVAVLRHARLRARLGATPAARRELVEFATTHADDRAASTALTLAAELANSDALRRDVVRRFPKSVGASRERMTLAATALARHDTAGAVADYTAELDGGGPNAEAARYLLARIALAQGDTVGRTALTALVSTDSLGYYGMMARQLIGAPPLNVPAPADHAPTPQVADALEQLDLLKASGFDREADLALAALVTRPWASPHEMLDLADGLIARGWTGTGIALGWRAARRLTLNDPRVLRTIFPWPHRALIISEARRFALDPYLLAGLIRQESSFKPDAQSRAGALGLMQLMPSTARGVARRLGVHWDPALTQVADANLHLGAAHLAQLLRRFDGEVVPAVAAYNAGGSAVSRWIRGFRHTNDEALFVERIPYAETRGYVRAVLRNRDLYRALYPEASDASLSAEGGSP